MIEALGRRVAVCQNGLDDVRVRIEGGVGDDWLHHGWCYSARGGRSLQVRKLIGASFCSADHLEWSRVGRLHFVLANWIANHDDGDGRKGVGFEDAVAAGV